jgi:hypothetical protein
MNSRAVPSDGAGGTKRADLVARIEKFVPMYLICMTNLDL